MLDARKKIFNLLFSCQVFFLSIPIYYFYSSKKSYYSKGLRTTNDKYCTGKSLNDKCLCLIHWYFMSICQTDIAHDLLLQFLVFLITLKKNLNHFTMNDLQISVLGSLSIFFFLCAQFQDPYRWQCFRKVVVLDLLLFPLLRNQSNTLAC